MIVFGDIHSDVKLLNNIIRTFNGQNLCSVGDLIDGPLGATGSAECVKLCREAGVQLVIGNHEAYPLYASSDKELVELWGEQYGSDTGNRIIAEWNAIRSLLTDEDMAYLYSGKLFIRGDDWIVAHAKVAGNLNVGELEVGGLTSKQIAFFDHTQDWQSVVDYDGRYGTLYVGHTRWSKVGRRYHWGNVRLLDFCAKKGEGVGVACTDTGRVWFVTANNVCEI